MSNTITAYFKGRVGVAESVYQNDYGMVMNFDSIDLPAHFDCYFSILNQEEAIPGVGAYGMVAIPNSVLANPGAVTIHIPIHTGANDSEVEYVVYFKVIGRARPIDDGTPAQMTAIEQALALLQNPITNIEQIVNEALDFTGDTFAEMQEQLDANQAAFQDDMGDRADAFEAEIRGDIADVESDFDNLNAQFQTAVGALTVDDELLNVRVGDDNVTYATAGEAVRKQFSALKSDLFDSVNNGGFPLNLSNVANAYCSTTIGSAITFTSSSASKTYKRIIPVKKGWRYILKVTASASPVSVTDRNAVVTDTMDIVRQVIPLKTVASTTFTTQLISEYDGYFYLTVDKNTVNIDIQGGMIFENDDSIVEIKSELEEIANVKHNYLDIENVLFGKYVDGSVGSHYSENSNANYWAYVMPVSYNKEYVLRRTDYRWLEIDEDGIVLVQHGNSNAVGYLHVYATNPNTKYIAFSWTTINPVNYMVLDPDVSFDDYIPYPNTNIITDDIIANSNLITKSELDVLRTNAITSGFNVKQNFFDAETAVTDKYVAGDIGKALRTADYTAYAYNVVPVEYGKTYIFSRSDYARFEFNKDMICIARVGDSTGLTNFEYTPSRKDVKYVAVSWYYTVVSVNAYMVTFKGVDRSKFVPYPNSITNQIPYAEKEIYIGADRSYTSIMAAFKAYENDTDPKVFYIDSGEYDIYNEIGGSAFLSTIQSNDSYANVSTFVPENSRVVGIGSVTLKYLPSSSDIPNDNAVSCISPINVRGNAEIENITIICKNCRYAIHDETGTNRRYDNTEKIYKRVRAIKQANDYVPSVSVIGGQAFGCGFGSANKYLFEECVFKSNITAFSMHNNPTVKNYQGSNVTIKNCVIDTDATQSMRFGAVFSDYSMENIINICNSYIKSRVTVTRESEENGADNTFNLTLLNCSDIEILDEFETHEWHSDYDIKVFNSIQ